MNLIGKTFLKCVGCRMKDKYEFVCLFCGDLEDQNDNKCINKFGEKVKLRSY